MKSLIQDYRWMMALAAITLLCLVIIQFNWLNQSKALQAEQQELHLRQTMPELGLAVDAQYRDVFHKGDSALLALNKNELEAVVDSAMKSRGYNHKAYFALFQDTTIGIFISNAPQFKPQLTSTKYRQCLSCIISFSISRGKDLQNGILPELTISRPVDNYIKLPGSRSAGEVLWLSVYIPDTPSRLIKSLTSIFLLSIGMLVLLMALFYYVMRAFSKHKKMSEVKVDFFNNLNHEFKTPLSSIHLASRVLRQSTDTEKNTSYLDLIERESKTLEKRLTRVLELSLFDNGAIPREMKDVDVHQIIQETIDRLRPLIDQKGAKIHMDLEAEHSTVQCDPDQLTNCMYNLLENALKYGGRNVDIHVGSEDRQGKLRLSIRDNGPGIDLSKHNDVFDRFYRIQKNDQYQGNGFGIGLSYVKSVIESYHGRIWINPDYTNGSEFIIEL